MKLHENRNARPDSDWHFGRLLISRGTRQPGAPFIFDVSGPDRTYGEMLHQSLRLAAALRERDVVKGSRVVSMVDNSADSVVVMGACALLSAIHVPINGAYVGHLLQHAVSLVEPTVAIVQDSHLPRFAQLALPSELTFVVRGRNGSSDWPTLHSLLQTEPLALGAIKLGTWEETSTLLFTSGTTGPSKAVVIPWLHLYFSSVWIWQGHELDETARIYNPWPINHISGAGGVYLTALLGGSIVFRDRWSTSEFIADVTTYSCNTTLLMGEMIDYIDNLPGIENTPLTHACAAPITERAQKLFTRMGMDYSTLYNSTETNAPIGSVGYRPVPVGSCGQIRDGVDIRFVDEHDQDVPAGAPGELLIRAHDEFAMNRGYWGMSEATEEAWRGGWFHTGDVLREDEQGNLYFVRRSKDRIRVRGENVSPDELESILKGHPQVANCAAVGIPVSGGEDKIHLYVVPTPEGVEEAEVRAYCDIHLPKFMRPAIVERVSSLPTTATGKVQRAVLRDRALGVSIADE